MNDTTSATPPEDQPSGEQSQALANSSDKSATEDPKEKLVEDILEGVVVPEPARKVIRERVELMMGIFDRSGQSLSPETAKILAASKDKEEDNKFQFLMKKVELDAEQEKRDHELKMKTFETKSKFAWAVGWTIVLPSFLVGVGVLAIGIYLCIIGKETLGASLVAGVITGVLSFIAGLGLSDYFKKSKD